MNDFIQLPVNEQLLYYEQAKAELGIPAATIEKDFWVCWTLKQLFELPKWKDKLTFKGGTSLSKVWNLIDRFSEDIDLIVDREYLGFGGENEPEEAQTSSQKKKRIERLKKACRKTVSEDLLSCLEKQINKELPDPSLAKIIFDQEDHDHNTIEFYYPRVFPEKSLEALLPYVKLEIGPRGDNWPADKHEIKPYLIEVLPQVFPPEGKIKVNVLDSSRTFLEKAMLLHEEGQRPESRKRKGRMARHYYDLYCMIKAGIGDKAIANESLVTRVREHRMFYYNVSWVDYETLRPGTMEMLPGQDALSFWEKDYESMKNNFFFGEVPSFTEIVNSVETFQDKWNALFS
ncbi:MAG: nucleotidyl transferase AbiEii/AbiGii toxin family protein [Verrucomicrobiota bacterium]